MSDLVLFPLDIQVFLCFPVFPATGVQGGLNCVCMQLFEACLLEHVSSDFFLLKCTTLCIAQLTLEKGLLHS